MPDILGVHRVTAITGDPPQNIDSCAGVLGLRLVKLTVNYDDPTTYHLHYRDRQDIPERS
jgi:glyoxalase family protein